MAVRGSTGISTGGTIVSCEAVSDGHPDKVADQISDALVDLFLSKDPHARVACEALVTTQLVVLAGEIRCSGAYERDAWAPGVMEEIEDTVRKVVRDIGYEQDGFHWETFRFENDIHGQSTHIAQGFDESGNKDEGAGDQGTMFGYATDETPSFMPMAHHYATRILMRLAADRRSGVALFLMPDAKSQVTLGMEDGKLAYVSSVIVSTQHAKGYDHGEKGAELRAYVKEVVADIIPPVLLTDATRYHINPTGSFEIGGPDGDAGLTGRKMVVDTYGGVVSYGGGAFSGKDPTKVDRSASYMARYIAKNIVAAGLARRCTIQLTYAIGVAHPLAFRVDTHGTGTVDEQEIADKISELVVLTPRGIRTRLNLNRPIFLKTASYGHFGREPENGYFPWEEIDLVPALKAALFTPRPVAPLRQFDEGATISAYTEFEPVVAEAGSLTLLRTQELIGRIFQNARVRTELRPTSAFSFVLRIHVDNDPDEVGQILKALLAYHAGDRQAVMQAQLSDDIVQELGRLSHLVDGLIRLSVETDVSVNGIRADVASFDRRLEVATQAFHDAFLAAVRNLSEPIEDMRDRLARGLDGQSAALLQDLVETTRAVLANNQVTQIQVDQCATQLAKIEASNPGFVRSVAENLTVGAFSGVLGNLLTAALQAGKLWPF